jgi:excisionase family DNA binding protein
LVAGRCSTRDTRRGTVTAHPFGADTMPAKREPLDLKTLPARALLSIPEAARYSHIGKTKMRELIEAKRIPVKRLDGRPRIMVADLDAFVDGLAS